VSCIFQNIDPRLFIIRENLMPSIQQFNPACAFYAKLFSQHNLPQYIFFTHTDKGENELVDYAVDMMQSMACLQMPVIVASGP